MTIRWDALPDYRPPSLPQLRWPERAFTAANVLVGAMTLVVAVTASSGPPGPASWARWIVIPAWLSMLGTGWYLCDRLATSVHLLDGRWPTRYRVCRAWLAPALWITFAELVVLSLPPTEVVDVRPAIAAVGFWFAAWRPFAAMRRIFLSLTRLSHDIAVMAFGLLHIVIWSLTWWLMHALPTNGSGIAWACVIASIGAGALPIHINRAYDQSLAHRVLALQTRDEHRYVRSLGLNPFHAGTYLALVSAKQERERRRGASDPVQAVRTGRRLTDTDGPKLGSRIWAGHRRRPAQTNDPAEQLADIVGDALDEVDGAGDTVTPDPTRTGEAHAQRPNQLPAEPGPHQLDAAAEPPPADPEESRYDEAPSDFETDDERVRPGALTDFTETDDFAEYVRPPRALSLEVARYAAMIGLVSASIAYAWVAYSALALEEPIVDGRLSDIDVQRLDRSRVLSASILVAALPIQAWWVVASRIWACRAGVRLALRGTIVLAAGASIGALGLAQSLAIDAAPAVQAVIFLAVSLTSGGAVLTATPVARWNGFGQRAIWLWASGLIVATIGHVATGGMRPIEPTTSVQPLAFVSVVIGLVIASVSIAAGVFTVEVEDNVKSSRLVARWYQRKQDPGRGEEREPVG